MGIYITHLVYTVFSPQKNSCFSSQKCSGIITSELQFYMEYFMFCLKQCRLKKNPHVNSLHLSVWMIVIQFAASGLVFDDLKSVSH